VIRAWDPGSQDELERLAEILHATVHDGASVSFVLPFSMDEARAYWRDSVAPAAQAGRRRVLVARLDGRIAGTVQLDLATPPNQPHRAEVMKLLVHPDSRRRGIARALMQEIEVAAREARRTLLTLDTRTGDNAEPLYVSLGYIRAGVIPRYACDPKTGVLEGTTFLYKEIS